jgi:hypothetical protein
MGATMGATTAIGPRAGLVERDGIAATLMPWAIAIAMPSGDQTRTSPLARSHAVVPIAPIKTTNM